MSDCSRDAMKAKEQPRTCGTCGHLIRLSPEEYKEKEACYVCYFQYQLAQEGSYPIWPLMCFDDPACKEHYKPRTDTLEQRYQQLEQVAWDMLRFIGEVADDPARSVAERYYHERLEALGASVDD